MKNKTGRLIIAAAATAFVLGTNPASAAVYITEVAPSSGGNSSPVAYNADWFELTNSGPAAVALAGWKMDDSSSSFASSVALAGITSIGAGESVVFVEGDATTVAGFKSSWFGNS